MTRGPRPVGTETAVELTAALRKRLIMQRAAHGLDQHELAELLGTTQSTMSTWERGRAQPSMKMFIAWATALGLTVELK